MKTHRLSRPAAWVLFVPALLLLAYPLRADSSRTQTFQLHQGWNSVFVEVTPANQDPALVFGSTPITMVATFFAVNRPVQFIQNPSAIGWNREGWGVWYAPSRPDSFLSSLHAINGNRAYLVYAQRDCTWTLTGSVAFQPLAWKNDSFNFVGFSMDPQGSPTFDQFFSGSKAHLPLRAYRLVNDQWTPITDPVRTAMRSGEACWVYCKGASDYQGPVSVALPGGQTMDFSNTLDSWINFINRSTNPLDIRIERISSDLPLAYKIFGITKGSVGQVSVDLPAAYSLPALEAGASTSFWLSLRRDKMTTPVQTGLIKITTDIGVQFWIPLKGTRPDLAGTATSQIRHANLTSH